jgi:15-cis-phytoene desaturase
MKKDPRRVLVLGAGVAGMTVAHELMERGYEVMILEQGLSPGGKAATQYPWKKFGDQLIQVPAEHGFRLFPSFYRHVIDTMERIPFFPAEQPPMGRSPTRPSHKRPTDPSATSSKEPPPRLGRTYHSVADNLIATPTAAMARFGERPRHVLRAYGNNLDGVMRLLRDALAGEHFYDRRETDLQRFQLKTLQYLTSCSKRRDDVKSPHAYGNRTWWEFLGAQHFAPRFQNEVDTFIRTMVAMEARNGSARTIGNVGMQLLLDLVSEGTRVDRVLNGPTSDQWLLPWEAYLRLPTCPKDEFKPFRYPVDFRYGIRVRRMRYDYRQRRIVEVVAEMQSGEQKKFWLESPEDAPDDVDKFRFHHVVAALPIDGMKRLLTHAMPDDWAYELVKDDPQLEWIRNLDLDRYTAWMAGIQFYLERDVPIVKGHVYYPEAPWKLSSVSQAQFWGPEFFENYGGKTFRGILSVDVCDWQSRVGKFAAGARNKVASECESAEVVADEVWEQLRHSLTVSDTSLLPDCRPTFHLDENIQFPHPEPGRKPETTKPSSGPNKPPARVAYNSSPYFIHPAGSHVERPQAHTAIKNLFLAGDYVSTVTDLATMEGANEAARRAVNAILEADGHDGQGCTLYPFEEPAQLDFFKRLDEDLFIRGEPHLFEALGLYEHVERSRSAETASTVVRMATAGLRGTQLLVGRSDPWYRE